MTPQELKNSILQLAIQGRLVEQRPEEGSAKELYQQIQTEKKRLIKANRIKKEKPLPEIAEDDIPFDIPESWKWVRFGELIRVIGGVSYKKGDVSKSGLRILRGGNIQNMQVLFDEGDVFLPSQYDDQEKSVQKGDIIIVASTGSKVVIGKAGYVDREMPSTMIGAFLRICRPFSLAIEDYNRCIFASDYYRKHVRNLSQGTNINNVKEAYVTELAVPLPPLAEQKRIVAKIEELLPFIDRYEKAWSKLEDLNNRLPDAMQKSILQMAIQGKLVKQRPEEGTGEELFRQIEASFVEESRSRKSSGRNDILDIPDDLPFEIPESWRWVRLGKIGYTNVGLTYSPKNIVSEGTVVLRSSNIQDGQMDYEDIVRVSKNIPDSKMCQTGDILICARNGSKRLVGKAAIINKEGMCFGAFMAVFRSICNPYVLHVINSAYFRNSLLGETGTTTINQITQNMLKNALIPLPPLAEQKRIVARLEEILPLCDRLKR